MIDRITNWWRSLEEKDRLAAKQQQEREAELRRKYLEQLNFYNSKTAEMLTKIRDTGLLLWNDFPPYPDSSYYPYIDLSIQYPNVATNTLAAELICRIDQRSKEGPIRVIFDRRQSGPIIAEITWPDKPDMVVRKYTYTKNSDSNGVYNFSAVSRKFERVQKFDLNPNYENNHIIAIDPHHQAEITWGSKPLPYTFNNDSFLSFKVNSSLLRITQKTAHKGYTYSINFGLNPHF